MSGVRARGSAGSAIAMELLRIRLAAIANEGYEAIVHTAVSPVVTESKDCSCTILDDEARLVFGGGQIPLHFWAAVNHVRAVVRAHGDTIVDGDVFIGNDPHSDTALHPQDVMVSKPVFLRGRLVGWVVNAAHVIDVGGMQFGSYAPAATECYQEALRLPPVRVIRGGSDQLDIWSIIRNNVRVPDLLEMDLRGMVAGCNVAAKKIEELITDVGGDEAYKQLVSSLIDASREAFASRIAALPDGTYKMTSWTEWYEELFRIPCTMTVSGDRLSFDYTGAAPQCNHLFNSKTWIVASKLVTYVWFYLAQDIPLTHGIFESIDLYCPEGSVLNSRPPAPVSAAHVDACGIAVGAGIYCLSLCLAAHIGDDVQHVTGQVTDAGSALTTWQFTGFDGRPDGCIMIDGSNSGSPAGLDRDGVDLLSFIVATNGRMELVDIEVLETWYPVLVDERRSRPGGGEGKYRGGAGCEMTFGPHGTALLTGTMMARRDGVPFQGLAGGRPGVTSSFTRLTDDGQPVQVGGHDVGVRVGPNERFTFRCNTGGGFGDPLDRDPYAVRIDVLSNRTTLAEARQVHGVVLNPSCDVDAEATDASRTDMLLARLKRASKPHNPPPSHVEAPSEPGEPLYPGIEQRGNVAVATASGAVLAVAPQHWTDGCPVLTERWAESGRDDVNVDMYLDPTTGRALHVDIRLDGEGRSFESLPRRWTESALAPVRV